MIERRMTRDVGGFKREQRRRWRMEGERERERQGEKREE